MKPRTKVGIVLGVFAVPLVVVWADLLVNALFGPGYLKLGYWWF